MLRTARPARTPTGLVLRRARAHPVLVAAAFVTVLLSVVGMTALLGFGRSVADQGLTRLLTGDPARAGIHVSGALAGPGGRTQDQAVRTAAARELGAVPTTSATAAQSLPYRLPSSADGPDGLTVFWAVEDLREHAHLTNGTWARPALSTGPVEVVVSRTAAGALALQPGSRLQLTSATFGAPVEAVVRGVYEPDDPDDPRWSLDPFGGTGVSEGEYTTYGPLTVPPETLLTRFASSARLSWVVQPDLRGVAAAELATVQDALDRFGQAVTDDPSFRSGSQIVTALPALLGQASRAVVVSRSTTPVPQLLLGALAAYAIWYVGWLMRGQRRGERALLRARGASEGQSARAALVEAVALVLPATLLAPYLAGWLLRWAAGPLGLTAAGFRPPEAMTTEVWPALALVGVGAVLALAAPALLQRDPLSRPGRSRRRPGLQRAGADLGLLVLAVLCYLQLRSAGSPFTSADVRSLQVDPVYVAAPVLLLAAIALLGLRLLPLLARAVERLAARGAAAAPALGVWPVSRRPLRHAGPLLLLVLALSVGLLAAVSTATGERSRVDQADFTVGADVRLTVPAGQTAGSAQQTGALLAATPGVTAAMPVRSDLVDTGSGSGSTTTLVALDSAVAPEVVLLRPDLAGPSPSTLYAPLQHDRGADLPAIATAGLLAGPGRRRRGHGRHRGPRRDDPGADRRCRAAVPDRHLGRGPRRRPRVAAAPAGRRRAAGRAEPVVAARARADCPAGRGRRRAPSRAGERGRRPVLGTRRAAGRPARPGLPERAADRARGRDALRRSRFRRQRPAVDPGATRELALLRALGMPRRAVAATVWLEQGLVLGLGVVLGLAVGLVVSTLIVPLTTVSSRTGAVVPPAIMTIPAAQTGALVAALLAILGATLAVVTRTALRGGTATGLQLEDQS